MAPHAHGETSISIVISGGLLERIGRIERNYARGHVALFPAGFIHSQLFGARGAGQIIITPEVSWLDYLAECGVRLCDAPHAHAVDFRLLGDRLFNELHNGDGFSGLVREGILLELIATFGRVDARCGTQPPAWLCAARDFLHDNPVAPLAMHELARVAGRHEIHVAREFRRFFGTSVGDYLRRLRTERAARFLSDSDDGISMIAQDCGFASHSHLCREFRRRFGVTPSQYRRSAKEL